MPYCYWQCRGSLQPVAGALNRSLPVGPLGELLSGAARPHLHSTVSGTPAGPLDRETG